VHPQAYLVSAGLGLVIVVGVIWPWLSVWGLRATLDFESARGREQEPLGMRLQISNRAWWGAWGLFVTDEAGAGWDLMGMAHVPGRRDLVEHRELIPLVRGEYPRGAPRVGTGFPFGLVRATREARVARRVLVWPRTFEVGPLPEAAGTRTGLGGVPRNRPGTDGEMMGVRPYRRGDSLRRIHWGQTARFGEPIVCELQTLSVPRVRVVLDADLGSHRGEGPEGSLEWSIRVAASYVSDWVGAGADVELVVGDLCLRPGGGSVASRRAAFLDALARLDARSCEPLEAVLARSSGAGSGGGMELVVTTDLGASRLPSIGGRGRERRFVVLEAGGFEGHSHWTEPVSLSFRPWITLSGPGEVASGLRRGWREVAHHG
jgi:uncharacterized protein (DUF58 family)